MQTSVAMLGSSYGSLPQYRYKYGPAMMGQDSFSWERFGQGTQTLLSMGLGALTTKFESEAAKARAKGDVARAQIAEAGAEAAKSGDETEARKAAMELFGTQTMMIGGVVIGVVALVVIIMLMQKRRR